MRDIEPELRRRGAQLIVIGNGSPAHARAFAAEGWFMQGIGWQGAALVWAYAIVELLASDVVKSIAARTLLQPTPSAGRKSHSARSALPVKEQTA